MPDTPMAETLNQAAERGSGGGGGLRRMLASLPTAARREAPAWRRWDWLIAATLLLGTAALYARTGTFDFVNFDDGPYVFDNDRVRAGLTWEGTRWALTTSFLSNWHPLTWLSYMLDVELFGVNPGAMHLVNAALHALAAILLYAALRSLTGHRWPSAWVAAMFAWHPLHVESVAWISERKDVLSTCFWTWAMIAYGSYARGPSVRRYLLVGVLLALGLMVKPMLVTLPAVFLLLDVWPLRRLDPDRLDGSAGAVLAEKLPLVGLVLLSALVTYLVQLLGHSVAPVSGTPLAARLANAVVSYAAYLRMTVAPYGLAIFYPHHSTLPGGSLSPWAVAGSCAVLAFATVGAWLLRRRQPWLLVGWFWYIGTLVPVIGVVQVGSQSRADRYTYVPLIGIFIAIAWAVRRLTASHAAWRRAAAAIGVAGCLAAAAGSHYQIGFWRDSETLMRRAVEVVPNNYLAHGSLGVALEDKGDVQGAERHYQLALRIKPDYATVNQSLATRRLAEGKVDEAMRYYERALRSDPHDPVTLGNYANLLVQQGRVDEAIGLYRRAIQADPEFHAAYNNLALALAGRGELGEAMTLWREALALEPEYPDAHYGLGAALLTVGRTEEGLHHLRESVRLAPGRTDALNLLAWTLATHPRADVRRPEEAIDLAGRAVERTGGADPVMLDTLAAALAQAGRFDRAVATAEQALKLAEASGPPALIRQVRSRLELYRSGRAFIAGR